MHKAWCSTSHQGEGRGSQPSTQPSWNVEAGAMYTTARGLSRGHDRMPSVRPMADGRSKGMRGWGHAQGMVQHMLQLCARMW